MKTEKLEENGAAKGAAPDGSMFATGNHAVDHQQDDRTDHRTDKACSLTRLVETECLTTISSEQRAADTQQDRHDPAHAVVTRFQEARDDAYDEADDDSRSEEHTSELQSLMRISYAVFCLKKKTKKK